MIDPHILEKVFFGIAGSFIYSAPRFVACAVACNERDASWGLCALELLVCLAIGAIAAVAFGSVALTVLHIQDNNAVSALVGLVANPAAPKLIESVSSFAAGILGAKNNLPKGDGKQ